MSLDNMVQRFPAKNEGSPLVSLAAMAGKEGQAAVTPCSQLDALCLKDSPANGEKRRDSVFFLPMSTTVVGAPDSLMSFSPVVEANESGAWIFSCHVERLLRYQLSIFSSRNSCSAARTLISFFSN